MKALFSSRKAQVNDVTYIIIIFFIMMAVAIALPYIQNGVISGSDYGTGTQGINSSSNAVPLINTSALEIDTTPNAIMGLSVFGSILKMLFWYYGSIPLILEIFFLILKSVFWILIYRQIRSGGG